MSPFHERTAQEIGIAHLRLCEQLCNGINPYSTSLNAPLQEAALPSKQLIEIDSDEDATLELVGSWLSGNGRERTTTHQRYIFMHSIFRAAVEAGARGHLAILASECAAEELAQLMMISLEGGNSDFVILTGQMQLEQLGKMLGDYKILVQSKLLPLMASRKQKSATDMENSTAEIFELMCKERGLGYIKAARMEFGNESETVRELEKYEQMFTSL